jgi:hypothetical protein
MCCSGEPSSQKFQLKPRLNVPQKAGFFSLAGTICRNFWPHVSDKNLASFPRVASPRELVRHADNAGYPGTTPPNNLHISGGAPGREIFSEMYTCTPVCPAAGRLARCIAVATLPL